MSVWQTFSTLLATDSMEISHHLSWHESTNDFLSGTPFNLTIKIQSGNHPMRICSGSWSSIEHKVSSMNLSAATSGSCTTGTIRALGAMAGIINELLCQNVTQQSVSEVSVNPASLNCQCQTSRATKKCQKILTEQPSKAETVYHKAQLMIATIVS